MSSNGQNESSRDSLVAAVFAPWLSFPGSAVGIWILCAVAATNRLERCVLTAGAWGQALLRLEREVLAAFRASIRACGDIATCRDWVSHLSPPCSVVPASVVTAFAGASTAKQPEPRSPRTLVVGWASGYPVPDEANPRRVEGEEAASRPKR